MNSKQVL